MTFQHWAFWACLGPAWLLWAALPARRRWWGLLGLSLAFFALLAGPWGLAALALCAGFAAWSARAPQDPGRFAAALAGIAAVLLAWRWGGALWGGPGFIGTLGVSYFSLQAAAYAADRHLGLQPAEAAPGRLLLYLTWFPKALQGPFERCAAFLERVDQAAEAGPNVEDLRQGLLLAAWGLFQKVVVADRAAQVVEASFGQAASLRGPRLYAAVIVFGLQLFADFSGYTDMARGVSRLFGIQLSVNFKAPFLAPSVAEFWRRWHISLSDWVRDYLFTPLQMAFRSWGPPAVYVSLSIGFFLVGLWHGAGAGFILLGSIQALWIGLALLTRSWRKRLWQSLGLERSRAHAVLQVLATLQLTWLALLLFKAGDAAGLKAAIGALARGWQPAEIGPAMLQGLGGGADPFERAVLAGGALTMVAVHLLGRRLRLLDAVAWLRWSAYAGLALSLLFFGRYFAPTAFLYARL